MNPFSTIKELIDLRDSGKISEQEIINYYLERIKKHDPKINSIIETFDPEQNSNLAPASGVLRGIPGVFKDNICIQGQIFSAGSNILSNYKCSFNSTVFERLKASGAPVIGRANCDEFAMGATGEFSAFGATKHPWDLTRTPGGSGSGSVAAVSAGLVPWSLGSETGGSIRQPAAFTGLVGMYPTYGLVSRYGLMAFGSSLDQIGPFTRTVYDCALLMSIIAGHDPEDSSSIPEPKHDYTRGLDGKLPENLRVGVLKDSLENPGVDEEIKQSFLNAIDQIEKMGAKIEYVDMPNMRHGLAVYFVTSRAEAASNLSRIDGTIIGKRVGGNQALEEMYHQTRGEGFGQEVKRRILMGNYVLSSKHRNFYDQAMRVRSMIRSEFEQLFNEVDVLLTPTTASLAFKLGDIQADPLKVYMSDYFVLPSTAAGIPGISVPSGYSRENLPMGLHILGPRLSEELLFKVAHAYEKNRGFDAKNPAGYED